MRLTPVLLSVALFGCGNSGSGNSAEPDRYANYVADQFMSDCKKAPAPNAKLANELDQLCTCSTNKIRSTVRFGDSDDLVNGKIREASQACEKIVYPNG